MPVSILDFASIEQERSKYVNVTFRREYRPLDFVIISLSLLKLKEESVLIHGSLRSRV